MSRKVRPNVPKLSQPVSKAISVMDTSVSRSSAVARSMRRVSRYRCGGTPKACLNDRAKWASETPLTRASRRTGQSSCEAASIRSFARSRRRNSSGSWRAGPPLMPLPDTRSDTIEPLGGSLPYPEMACIHVASRCAIAEAQRSAHCGDTRLGSFVQRLRRNGRAIPPRYHPNLEEGALEVVLVFSALTAPLLARSCAGSARAKIAVRRRLPRARTVRRSFASPRRAPSADRRARRAGA